MIECLWQTFGYEVMRKENKNKKKRFHWLLHDHFWEENYFTRNDAMADGNPTPEYFVHHLIHL